VAKEKKGDYEVGYGRPPKKTQFKKGQTGNPKGRPKKSKDIADTFKRLADEIVTIREGNQIRELSTREAALFAQVAKAMKGDQTAFVTVMSVADKCGLLRNESQTNSNPLVDFGPKLSEKEWEKMAVRYAAAQKIALAKMAKEEHAG
jgi:hypothetical protein